MEGELCTFYLTDDALKTSFYSQLFHEQYNLHYSTETGMIHTTHECVIVSIIK